MQNSYQCKILTVITETLIVQPAGFNTINDDIHEHAPLLTFQILKYF